MKRSAFQDAAEVTFCRSLLIGVDERQQGLADELVGLLREMACEDGVEIQELELGGEERPVWGRKQ